MCLALNFDLESWASKPFTRAHSEWERKLAVVVETMKVELVSLMLLEFLMSDKYRMVSFKKKKKERAGLQLIWDTCLLALQDKYTFFRRDGKMSVFIRKEIPAHASMPVLTENNRLSLARLVCPARAQDTSDWHM